MRYRMVTRLGRGGMGDVWRADDLMLETPVALKLIRSTSQAGRERLLQEVRLARRVTHPSVVRVFDVGEAEDEVFFSMELVEGQDLASVLRHAGRLAPARVVEIARQLCARAAGGARRGRAPPRSEAGQRAGRSAGPRPHHRLRHRRPGRRARRPHHRRDAALHGARAAPRRRHAHAADRPLRAGGHALRAAHRPASGAAAVRATARWCRRRCSRLASTRRSRTSSCGALSTLPGGRPASAAAFAAALPGDEPEVHALRGVIATAASAIVLDAHVVGVRSPASLALLAALAGVPRPTRVGRAHQLRHHRPRRLRQHHQRAAVRRRPQGRAGDRPRAVAVPQGVPGQPRPGNAAPDGAPAGLADHARGGPRDRGARALQGDDFGLDRQPGPQLRADARSHQRPERRRHGTRAGRGPQQGRGADGARRCGGEPARAARRVVGVGDPVRRAAAQGHHPVARGAARLRAGARQRQQRLDRGESDPAPAARHRARPRLRAGAGRALRRLRQHQPDGAGAGLFEARVRPARPRQRARALLHLVALLPRRDAGLGQGARPGPRVDRRLPARDVRVQRARPGRRAPRPAPAKPRRRCARRSSSTRASCRRRATSATTCSGRASSRRPRRTSRQSIAAGVDYHRGVPRRLPRLAAAGRRGGDGEVSRGRPQDRRRARHGQLGRASGGVLRAARGGARRRRCRAAAGAAAEFQGMGRSVHGRGRRDPRDRRALRRGASIGARGARVEPRHPDARHQRPRARLVRRRRRRWS